MQHLVQLRSYHQNTHVNSMYQNLINTNSSSTLGTKIFKRMEHVFGIPNSKHLHGKASEIGDSHHFQGYAICDNRYNWGMHVEEFLKGGALFVDRLIEERACPIFKTDSK